MDGNAVVMRSLCGALARACPEQKIELFVDSAPRRAFEQSNVGFRVLRPFPAGNRALARIAGGDPWYRFRLAVDPRWRSLNAFIGSAHEPVPWGGGPPRIAVVYDLAFMLPESEKYFPKSTVTHLDKWTSANVHTAAKVVAISATTAADIARIYGVPKSRIAVWCTAHDPSTFRPDIDGIRAAETLRRFGLERPYILHVGTDQPRKNLPALLRAHKILWDASGTRHRLVLVGAKGWESSSRKQGESGQWDGVDRPTDVSTTVRCGPLPPAEVAQLMACADVLVMAGFYEGFGLPALEAMACGTPVVVARAGALPELVGDAGAYFDPRSPEELAAVLGGLLSDERRRAEMRELGLKRAAEFTWEKHAEGLLAVVREVAGRADS